MFHSALDSIVCHSDYDSAVIMHSKLYSKHIQWFNANVGIAIIIY